MIGIERIARGVRREMRRASNRCRQGLVLLPVMAALLLSACGVPSGPPTAASVLRQAQTAKITDLRFTATGTFASSLSAILGGQSANGSSFSFQAEVTGTLTTTPRRTHLALALGQKQSVAVEIITDAATQTGYVRLPFLAEVGLDTGQWIAVPLDGLATYLDTSIFTDFEQLTQATLVGTETIQGVAVYHLRGAQQLQAGIGEATEDFYVRQDNAYPVRVTIQGTVNAPTRATDNTNASSRPAATVKVNITFTGVNTGNAIALPSGSQVAGQ